ncbi:EAL domain-containing protein [Idiomarina seosinensis]|uniref:EAL domain-containing protein n=1 Tax=Idiomarina seosinensis TaxID=281739 RepID=UPI00385020BE
MKPLTASEHGLAADVSQVVQPLLDALNYSAIISLSDKNGVITYVNEQFEKVSGYSRAELLGNNHNILRHPDTPDRVFASLWRTISSNKPWRGLLKNRRKDGQAYYVKSVILPITNAAGDITQYLSIRTDVTDIIKARTKVREQRTDQLTGLPNRVALLADLEKYQLDSAAVFDLRNFKLFNDYWGIEAGDSYIKKLAQLFSRLTPPLAVRAYRLSGACFGIRPLQACPPEQFCLAAEQLKYQLEHYDMLFRDIDCDIQVTVGVGVSATRALAYAESAVADSKEKFYGRSVVIKNDGNSRDDTFYWLEQIKEALRDRRVLACFQKISSGTEPGALVTEKYEALARLQLKDGRIVSPGEFIEDLKKTRYYTQLTRTMLGFALDFAAARKSRVSVNLSIQDILDSDTVDFIEQQLQRHGGEKIIFEITESEAINDFQRVSAFIQRVRRLGAAIAIDDFGSGYSNFVYLVKLQPEYIKIDGSIISSIVDNPQSFLVTQSIVQMAHNLKIKTIAEFVSDRDIFERLLSLKVDYLQGFFVHQPELA